jgi:hypothetical protein
MLFSARRLWWAVVATVALVGSVCVPVSAAHAEVLAYRSDGAPISLVTPETVPVFEPAMDRGVPLVAGVSQSIPLGDATIHSALVRVSVFDVASLAHVSVAGAVALVVPAGRSVSTTVLVPVEEGVFDVLSDVSVDARVELVAGFKGSRVAPGQTVALPTPVTRADSSARIGVTQERVETAPVRVGVLGSGGVPTSGVRAVHVTVGVDASAPATVHLGQVSFPIPAGTTEVSTVVAPEADGTVSVSASGAAVGVRVDVRGYVVEASGTDTEINGPGSYWNAVASTVTSPISAGTALDIPVQAGAGQQYALMMVSASAPNDLTLLNAGVKLSGRAVGAVADPALGVVPQLMLLPVTGSRFDLRRGHAEVSSQQVGIILSGDQGSTSQTPAMTLDKVPVSPLVLTDLFSQDFGGTITTAGGAVPLRIEVERNDEAAGVAHLVTSGNTSTWSYTAYFQKSGTYHLLFRVVDRAGGSTEVQWSGEVKAPGDPTSSSDVGPAPSQTPVVVTPSTKVISKTLASTIVAVDSRSVSFSTEPSLSLGDVMVVGASPSTPSGLMRKVAAIDRVDQTWVVSTTQARLEDVFLQADFSRSVPLDARTATSLATEADTPAAAALPGSVAVAGLLAPTPRKDDPAAMPFGSGKIEQKFEISQTRSADITKSSALGEVEGTVEGSIKASASASAELALVLNFTLKISPRVKNWIVYPSVDIFSLSLDSTATVSAGLSAELAGTASVTWTSPTFFHSRFPAVELLIGFIPLVIDVSMEAAAEAELKLAGTITFPKLGFDFEQKQTVGFSYSSDAGLRDISTGPTYRNPSDGEENDTTFEGSAEFSIGPKITFALIFEGLLKPEIELGAKIGIELKSEIDKAKSFAEQVLTRKFFVQGSLEAKFAAEIPILQTKLFELTIGSALERKIGLGPEEEIPFCKIFPQTACIDPSAPANGDTSGSGASSSGTGSATSNPPAPPTPQTSIKWDAAGTIPCPGRELASWFPCTAVVGLDGNKVFLVNTHLDDRDVHVFSASDSRLISKIHLDNKIVDIFTGLSGNGRVLLVQTEMPSGFESFERIDTLTAEKLPPIPARNCAGSNSIASRINWDGSAVLCLGRLSPYQFPPHYLYSETEHGEKAILLSKFVDTGYIGAFSQGEYVWPDALVPSSNTTSVFLKVKGPNTDPNPYPDHNHSYFVEIDLITGQVVRKMPAVGTGLDFDGNAYDDLAISPDGAYISSTIWDDYHISAVTSLYERTVSGSKVLSDGSVRETYTWKLIRSVQGSLPWAILGSLPINGVTRGLWHYSRSTRVGEGWGGVGVMELDSGLDSNVGKYPFWIGEGRMLTATDQGFALWVRSDR